MKANRLSTRKRDSRTNRSVARNAEEPGSNSVIIITAAAAVAAAATEEAVTAAAVAATGGKLKIRESLYSPFFVSIFDFIYHSFCVNVEQQVPSAVSALPSPMVFTSILSALHIWLLL